MICPATGSDEQIYVHISSAVCFQQRQSRSCATTSAFSGLLPSDPDTPRCAPSLFVGGRTVNYEVWLGRIPALLQAMQGAPPADIMEGSSDVDDDEVRVVEPHD